MWVFTFIENKYDKKNETIKHLMSGAMSAMGILRRNVLFAKRLKMMTGLISLLTHQYTLTHCLRCNSGWRGWRGRSIDLSGAERWSLFDLNLSSYSLCLPLLHCIIVYQELSNTCFLLTVMPLMKYQTSAQLVAGVLKPNLLSRFDPCNIFKVKPIKQNYCSKYEELVDGVKCP